MPLSPGRAIILPGEILSFFPQLFKHILMVGIKKVGIDFSCRRWRTMPQGSANVIQRDPFGTGDTGEAVTQPMQGQRRQTVVLDKLGEQL